MNYNQFIKSGKAIDQLLHHLKIRDVINVIVEVDHNPDYSLTDYRREVTSDYIFKNRCACPDIFDVVFTTRILKCVIFFDGELDEISAATGIPNFGDRISFLNRVHAHSPDLLEAHEFEPDTDEFKLREIRVNGIDNELRVIHYEGSFFGDSASIDPIDWKLYAFLEVEGLVIGQDFYKSLIAESISLQRESKYNLSYFLLHAAFESFVNYQLDAMDERGEFAKKVNQLYAERFGAIAKHQVYCSLISKLNGFSHTRNAIAHGRGKTAVTAPDLQDALLFVLIMIDMYLHKTATFLELHSLLQTPVHEE